MSKKALRVRVYASNGTLVLEKTGVHVDSIPAALELMPEGGHVECDIVELGSDSAV